MSLRKIFLPACMLVLLVGFSQQSASAASPLRNRIGTASGALGGATIDGEKLTIGSPVLEGSKIVTGPNDSAAVLLNSSVVVKFDVNTTAVLTEEKGTHFQLISGNVEVFIAKRLPTQKAVALSDSDATIEALGTVFIAGYSPATRDGFYACVESTRPQGIMAKGIADDLGSDVAPGKYAKFHAGKLQGLFDVRPADIRQHVGHVRAMDMQANHQAGVILRQQSAVTAAGQLMSKDGRLLIAALAGEENKSRLQDAIADSSQFITVNRLTAAGILSATGGGGGGGGGGAGGSGGTSSGGFSNASVALDAGGLLRFRLFDASVQDGDTINLKITDNGKTVLNIPGVTLTNAGQIYTSQLNPGNVSITVTAVNEGDLPPNSGAVSILSTVSSGKASQSYNITTGQTATMKLKVK